MTPITLLLRAFRKRRGWSQAELARRSGVPQATISRLEAKRPGKVDLQNLEKLANALGVQPGALLKRTK